MGRALSPTDLPGIWDGVDGRRAVDAVEQATPSAGAARCWTPSIGRRKTGPETRLANQELDLNGVAGQRALGNLGRQRQQDYNDLSMRSVLAGRQEHSRRFGQGVQGRQLAAGLQRLRFNQQNRSGPDKTSSTSSSRRVSRNSAKSMPCSGGL